jgi:hypothetical protein
MADYLRDLSFGKADYLTESSVSVRLLRSHNFALVVSFLFTAFRKKDRQRIFESDLRLELTQYLESLSRDQKIEFERDAKGYTPGYLANHWCSRGHVLFVLEGELVTELKDGQLFTLRSGMSYQVATDAEPHRSSTSIGAKLFIVD